MTEQLLQQVRKRERKKRMYNRNRRLGCEKLRERMKIEW
jgi:hypothetical protein